jgi:hypothetical protein
VEDHGGPPADGGAVLDVVVALVLAGQLHVDPDVLAEHGGRLPQPGHDGVGADAVAVVRVLDVDAVRRLDAADGGQASSKEVTASPGRCRAGVVVVAARLAYCSNAACGCMPSRSPISCQSRP